MKIGWHKVSIADVAAVVTGTTPPTAERENYGNYLPFVSPGDLSNTKYVATAEKFLSKKGTAKARVLPVNSSLFTCIGSTIGKVGLSAIELATNQQINAAIPNENIFGEYLYYALDHIALGLRKLQAFKQYR